MATFRLINNLCIRARNHGGCAPTLLRGRRALAVAAAAAVDSVPQPPSPLMECVVGIETSCDDTGVAVIGWPVVEAPAGGGAAAAPDDARLAGAVVLCDVLASQAAIHAPYAGVVPHFAARAHELNLPPVYRRAMEVAGLPQLAQPQSSPPASPSPPPARRVVAVGATAGPGLSLCLRAGFASGLAAAAALGVPFVPVNHLEAHLLVPRLVYRPAGLPFPYLVLLVSGGHSLVALAHGVGRYTVLGGTKDDSLGEAFDKVARMLGAPAVLAQLEAADAAATPPVTSAARPVAAGTSAAAAAAAAPHQEDYDMLRAPGAADGAVPAAAGSGDDDRSRADAVRAQLRDARYSPSGRQPLHISFQHKPAAAADAAGAPSPPQPTPPTADAPANAHLGATLERLAKRGNEHAVKLPVPLRAAGGPVSLAFSFSGLKSAIHRFVTAQVAAHGGALPPQLAADTAASFQRTATAHVCDQLARALAWCDLQAAIGAGDVGGGAGGLGLPPVRSVVVVGGVASNGYLRAAITELCASRGKAAAFPPPRYCTDNGVMVAWATAERVAAGLVPELPAGVDGAVHRDDGSGGGGTPRWDIDPRWRLGAPPPVAHD
jgi:tRNA A37 threonylcarbamoyltransferase TsaD